MITGLETGRTFADLQTVFLAHDPIANTTRQSQVDSLRESRAAQQTLSARVDAWKSTGVGARYFDASLNTPKPAVKGYADVVAKCQKYCDTIATDKRNLLLFGPIGTGKDYLQAAILRAATINYGVKTKWTDGQELAAACRDTFSNDEIESSVWKPLANAPLLGLSDPFPTTGAMKDHHRTVIRLLLEQRYRKKLPTITTANVSSFGELKTRLGPDIADRLRDDSELIFCNWPSLRKHRPDK